MFITIIGTTTATNTNNNTDTPLSARDHKSLRRSAEPPPLIKYPLRCKCPATEIFPQVFSPTHDFPKVSQTVVDKYYESIGIMGY